MDMDAFGQPLFKRARTGECRSVEDEYHPRARSPGSFQSAICDVVGRPIPRGEGDSTSISAFWSGEEQQLYRVP